VYICIKNFCMKNEKQGRQKNAEHKQNIEVSCLRQGSEINGFFLNRVRVWRPWRHAPTQTSVKCPPPPWVSCASIASYLLSLYKYTLGNAIMNNSLQINLILRNFEALSGILYLGIDHARLCTTTPSPPDFFLRGGGLLGATSLRWRWQQSRGGGWGRCWIR